MTERVKEAGITDTSKVFFQDEMRLGLIGQVRRVWAPYGVKIYQPVEVSYQWEYLNLAVNGLEGRLYWEWTPDMKKGSTIKVVEKLREKGVGGIVWDGAPSHRAREVRRMGIPLIRQPPYSPELNPAERVFEEVRGAVEGKVYGNMEKKKKAVEKVLRKFSANPEKVESLAGWDWIREAMENIPTKEMALV